MTAREIDVHIGCPYLKESELRKLQENGKKILIIDDIGQYPKHKYFYGYIFAKDVSTKEVARIITSWVKERQLDLHSVFTLAEGSVNKCNEVAHLLGVNPISTYQDVNLRDKHRIRESLRYTEFSIPIFSKVESLRDLKLYNENDFPLIVKPFDSMASRNVKIVYNNDELRSSVEDVFVNKTIVNLDGVDVNVEESYAFENKALVESFIEGQEISLEVLYIDRELVAWIPTLKITCGAPYFQEQGHISGLLELSEAQVEKINKLIERLSEIQKYHTTILHVEVKLLDDGRVLLVECNSRAAGDGILELLEFSTGNNLLLSLIDRNTDLNTQTFKKACRVFMSTDTEGAFFPNVASLDYGKIHYYYKEGETVSPLITEKSARVGEVVILDESRDLFNASYEQLMLELEFFFTIRQVKKQVDQNHKGGSFFKKKGHFKLAVLSTLIIILTSIGGLYLTNDYYQLIHFRTKRLAYELKDPVALKNLHAIRDELRRFHIGKWATEVVVTDSEGAILLSLDNSYRPTKLYEAILVKKKFSLHKKITSNGVSLGNLYIDISYHRLLLNLLIFLLISVAISLLFYVLLVSFLLPMAFKDVMNSIKIMSESISKLSLWIEELFSFDANVGEREVDSLESVFKKIDMNIVENRDVKDGLIGLLPKLKQLERVIINRNEMTSRYFKARSTIITLNTEIDTVEEKAKLESEMAAQVAHDIRSPLAALDMVMRDTSGIPEQKRLIMKSSVDRIHDIANDLLVKNREGKRNIEILKNRSKIFLVTDELNSLVSEKRMQFRDKIGLRIDYQFDSSSYGLFGKADVTHFNRVISNIINNAVESITSPSGVVTLLLRSNSKNNIEIIVKDSGRGMAEETLRKIGKEGNSFHKEDGNGLGLSHAIKSLEGWGGSLDISSVLGAGTEVIINLPKAERPESFVSEIPLCSGDTIVILDDDLSIHQIWEGRIESLFLNEKPSIVHFSSPDEFTSWAQSKKNKESVDLFLVDFEYIGHEVNGIDVINNQDIVDRSILVTSRYKEDRIQTQCEKSGLKLLPKGLAGFVPIKELPSSEVNIETILIDDDDLVRMVWEMAFETADKSLRTFSSSAEFMNQVAMISKSSPIYIDSDLGENVRGEDIATSLHAEGFENLYMATGHEASKFSHLGFLKGVIGKRAPVGQLLF